MADKKYSSQQDVNTVVFSGMVVSDVADLRFVGVKKFPKLSCRLVIQNLMADNPTWVTVVLWGVNGERLAKYLTKGKKIHGVGSLAYESFEAKDGTKVNRLYINASNIQLVYSNGSGNGNSKSNDNADAAPDAAPDTTPDTTPDTVSDDTTSVVGEAVLVPDDGIEF